MVKTLQTKAGYIVAMLAFFVFFAGLAYSYWLGDTLRYFDEGDYYAIAQNLALKGFFSTDGLSPSLFRPPGYPFMLSVAVWMGAGVVQLRAINFALLAGCVVLVYALLRKHVTPLAGLSGAIMVLCYPVLFYTAGALYPQTLGAFLLLASLWILIGRDQGTSKALSHNKSSVRHLLAGVAFGFLILVIPTFIVSLLVTTLWLSLGRRMLKSACIVTIAALVIVGIWTIRNYLIFKTFVPVSANSGVMLIAGNSENTTANSGISTDINKYFNVANSLPETERDAFYRAHAIAYMQANPGRMALLYISKLANYFNFRNELLTKDQASPLNNIVMLLTYYPLLILAVLMSIKIKSLPLSRYEWLLVGLCIADALFSAIFFTRIRYRLPFDFLVILLGASYLAKHFKALNPHLRVLSHPPPESHPR